MCNKRDKILKATLEVIQEFGLQSASMSQIIKKANVGTGTVYNYFKSKEELVSTLLVELYQKINDFVMETDNQGWDAQKRLMNVWSRILDFCLEYPKEFSFIENYCHSPYINEQAKYFNTDIAILMNKLYEELSHKYKFRDLPTEVIMVLSYNVVIGYAKGAMHGKFAITDKDRIEVLKACWNMMLE